MLIQHCEQPKNIENRFRETFTRDADDEWATAKVMANNVEVMLELFREATTLPRS